MNRIIFPIVLVGAQTLLAQTPAVVDGGVLNGASFAKDSSGRGLPVAAGSLVSIYGTDLATQLQSFDSVPFSTSLGGVSVTFNNVPAPMRDLVPQASPPFDQLNVQVPWNVLPQGASGQVNVVVTRNGVPSTPKPVQINAFAPGVFSIPPGIGTAIVVNPDGSIAAPPGAIPGYPTRPAKRGEIVFFYANGLGAVDNTPVNGGVVPLPKLGTNLTNPTILVGGVAVGSSDFFFSGLAPEFPGVNQVNFRIPANAPTGDKVPLQLQMGGVTTTDQVTIAIAQ